MKPSPTQLAVIGLIGLFALALLGSVILNGWGYFQIYGIGGWRDVVYGLQGMVASDQALHDFRDGHLRLYRFGGESETAKFTGTNDGPFEVWVPQFYPSLGRAHRYSTEQFIEFYNRKMHYMFSNPEKFRTTTGSVEPGVSNQVEATE
jgi:hypothetical protein